MRPAPWRRRPPYGPLPSKGTGDAPAVRHPESLRPRWRALDGVCAPLAQPRPVVRLRRGGDDGRGPRERWLPREIDLGGTPAPTRSHRPRGTETSAICGPPGIRSAGLRGGEVRCYPTTPV